MVVDGNTAGFNANTIAWSSSITIRFALTLRSALVVVVTVAMSMTKMMVASSLTCWADPSLDPKLKSSKLLSFSYCHISFDTISR